MANWFISSGCPFVVIANKCDKLSKSEQEPNAQLIRETLELPADAGIIMFSLKRGQAAPN